MPIHFFLIDDDADDRELFQEALSEVDDSIEFETCSDAREALTLLASDGAVVPDVVFLDANLPKMSGWECLEYLKASPDTKDIPVVMYSTSSYQRDIDRAMDSGAVWFFTKPSSFEDLKRLLTVVIACVKNNTLATLSGKKGSSAN